MSHDSLRHKIERLAHVSARQMFGYECYSVKGKFFVGFNRKNKFEVIIRLPKDEQQKAVQNKGIKPFSHGAKVGWIEIDIKHVSDADALKWIRKGYDYALRLAKRK